MEIIKKDAIRFIELDTHTEEVFQLADITRIGKYIDHSEKIREINKITFYLEIDDRRYDIDRGTYDYLEACFIKKITEEKQSWE